MFLSSEHEKSRPRAAWLARKRSVRGLQQREAAAVQALQSVGLGGQLGGHGFGLGADDFIGLGDGNAGEEFAKAVGNAIEFVGNIFDGITDGPTHVAGEDRKEKQQGGSK